MRKKRNERNLSVPTDGYIKKYFGTDIGRILVPSARSLQNCDELPYVSHPDAENKLNDMLVGDPMKDKSLVFTGLTGSGKTTILRHVFNLEFNASKYTISGDTMIVPVDFNRSHSSAQDSILSSLRAAVQKIVEMYGIDFPDFNNESFYRYICERRSDLLFLDSKHNQSTSYSTRMIKFLESMPTAFASCQLQYVMDHPRCKIYVVVLVVDNVEGFWDPKARNSMSRYLAPIIEAFRLADCIDQRGESTKWCFNMVIACRHHIWRIMKGEFNDNSPENALLQSYVTTESPYDLSQPIKVNDIIQKREEVFARKQNNPEKWREAVNVVNTILKEMEGNIGDFVTQLELKDLRKTLSKIQELVLHKRLQKQSDEEIATGAFRIDSVDQFDLTRVNLIRTIGLESKTYYADSTSTIPNLLFNEREEGFELYPLLTLNYFINMCGYKEPTWDNSVSISDFYEKMRIIFGFNEIAYNNVFVRAVHFLIKHRLLLRSADQPQDEVPGLTQEEMRKIEQVYVSGAAIKLWEELGKSSALFQLFLDDIWLDDDFANGYFEENGNDIEHCVKYLVYLKQRERIIYNHAKNISRRSEENYINAFGTTPICYHLLNGLIASLRAISVSNYMHSQIRIDRAKMTLKETERLYNELLKWRLERESIKRNIML